MVEMNDKLNKDYEFFELHTITARETAAFVTTRNINLAWDI